MVPVASIITGITLVFTFHMRCISIVRSLYFRIFSASFFFFFLSPEIAASFYIHVLFPLSWIIISGLLLGMVLSVWTYWFHSMVTLPPWSDSTDFGTCSYRCFLATCTPVSFHMLKCSCAHTLSCLFMYCSFASMKHADIIWSTVSSLFIIIIIIYYNWVSLGGSSTDKTRINIHKRNNTKNTVHTTQNTVNISLRITKNPHCKKEIRLYSALTMVQDWLECCLWTSSVTENSSF
jgi:hypothetical protein